MNRIRRILAVVAIAVPLLSLDAGAASRASLADIESQLLTDVAKSPAGGMWLGTLPRTAETTDAMLQFWRDLFADPAFVAATEQWLQGQQFDEKNVLYKNWLNEFNRIIVTGLQHWTDDDIRAFFGGTMAQSIFRDPELCASLVENPAAPPDRRMLERLQPSRSDVMRLLATTKRTYLDALANKVPQPMASPQQLEAAGLRLLLAVPEKDRETYLELAARLDSATPAQVCRFTALQVQAMLTVPGDSGRLLRRSYFIEYVLTSMGARASSAPAEVRNAASGQFQPGSATLHYPPLATRAAIEGVVTMGISVNEQGLATRVRTLEATFNKPSVDVEGKSIPSWQLFEPVTQVFYQAGRFMQRFDKGKPVPYEAQVQMVWRLDLPGGTEKNVFGPITDGRTLVVTVPRDWEDRILVEKPLSRFVVQSTKSVMFLMAAPSKTANGTVVSMTELSSFQDHVVKKLLPSCVERDARMIPNAQGEGATMFCTDKNHNPANPNDYKYTHAGIVKVEGTFIVFSFQSNEEEAAARALSEKLRGSIKFYDTVRLKP